MSTSVWVENVHITLIQPLSINPKSESANNYIRLVKICQNYCFLIVHLITAKLLSVQICPISENVVGQTRVTVILSVNEQGQRSAIYQSLSH